MTAGGFTAASLTVVGVLALLAAERSGNRTGIWLAKPTASAGFVLLALAEGATGNAYGTAILVALLLSFIGDVALIPRGTSRIFVLGLVSFLLGHLAFAAAFIGLGVDWIWGVGGLVVVLGLSVPVVRWLLALVDGALRLAVLLYAFVIGTMLVCSLGAAGGGAPWLVPVGALTFCISDLAVARERFVEKSFRNKLWGLPLYYGAQLLLAASVS